MVDSLALLKTENEMRDKKVQQLEETCTTLESRIDEYSLRETEMLS